jgi:uncharacterized protein (DUF885 family)
MSSDNESNREENNNDEYQRYLEMLRIINDMHSEDLSEEDRINYIDMLKGMYEEINGMSFDESDIIDNYYSDNIRFAQDMSDEADKEIFETYIKEKDLDLVLNFEEVGDMVMVNETWSSTDGSINISRMYNLEYIVIQNLDEDLQLKIYEQRMGELVEQERYEEAAECRDIISYIKQGIL